MALSDEKMRACAQKLLLARMKLLNTDCFYGLLLMHMVYSLDEGCKTVRTNGHKIYFNPSFLESLSDRELEFVLLHEILHVVLRHTKRRGEFKNEEYDRACDIVVNSNILLSNNMNDRSITLSGKACEHIAPDGREGHECSVEELYHMLLVMAGSSSSNENPNQGNGKGKGDDSEGDGDGDCEGAGEGKGDGKGKGKGNGKGNSDSESKGNKGWDDHSKWGEEEENMDDEWAKRLFDAANAVEIRNKSNQRGTVPLFAQRLLNDFTNPKTDWRTMLNDFIQEEICDYSFTPPDRRFDDSPFFLPDFNEKDEKVKDILFMIDTSGSMGDKEVQEAYSEIKGAIDQFNGKLEGYLGFFDATVVEPKPFCDEEEFKIIRPYGGGGTSFRVIFEYVKKRMEDNPPVSIVILTDGYAPFPYENEAMGIPVLWMINNEEVTPPWGRVARI